MRGSTFIALWNEDAPQTPCWLLDLNSWVDPNYTCRTFVLIQTWISSSTWLKRLGSVHEKINFWTGPESYKHNEENDRTKIVTWLWGFSSLPRAPLRTPAWEAKDLGTKLQIFHDGIVFNYMKRLEHNENQTKYRNMTRKPRRLVRILMYRTWAICDTFWRTALQPRTTDIFY